MYSWYYHNTMSCHQWYHHASCMQHEADWTYMSIHIIVHAQVRTWNMSTHTDILPPQRTWTYMWTHHMYVHQTYSPSINIDVGPHYNGTCHHHMDMTTCTSTHISTWWPHVQSTHTWTWWPHVHTHKWAYHMYIHKWAYHTDMMTTLYKYGHTATTTWTWWPHVRLHTWAYHLDMMTTWTWWPHGHPHGHGRHTATITHGHVATYKVHIETHCWHTGIFCFFIRSQPPAHSN